MTEPANRPVESFKQFAAWLAALFLVVLGAKLWVVQLYGSPLLWWDQWYEATTFIKGWLDGQLTWKDYLAPYCEHRILFTRLLDVGTIWLNGRWEPMLQMAINAFIHTVYVCGLALGLWAGGGRRDGWLICCLLAPFFALPYAAENTIWAFNSQAYFLAFFALPAMAGLVFGKPGDWRWCLGLAAAVLDLFTMASGLLTSLAIAGLILLRAIRLRRLAGENLITLGACLAVAGLGAALYVPYEGDRLLRAQNLMQFVGALERNLAWPFFNAPAMACLILLPLIWLAVKYLRRDYPEGRAAEFPLALGFWGILQCLALAYGRGNFGEVVPASRFMDKLNVLAIASLFAWLAPVRGWFPAAFLKRGAALLPLLWAAIIFLGLVRVSGLVVTDLLVPTRSMNLIAEERVAAFMASGDERDLLEPPTVPPDPRVVLGALRDKDLQAILPAACLPPAQANVMGRFTGVLQWLLRHATVLIYCGLGWFIVLVAYGLIRSPAGLAWENLPAFAVLLALLGSLGFVWTKTPITRNSVEQALQFQLAEHFRSINNPRRAAIHEQKAEALKASVEGPHGTP
jgi:hypothetical protein